MIKYTKKQWGLLIAGLTALIIGLSITGFFVVRKIVREIDKQQLMNENVVVEIPELNIKAPVLEGTDNEILSKAAGHFADTGKVGSRNYCIAAHSSVIYDEYFNDLKDAEIGMEIYLYDNDSEMYSSRTKYIYHIKEIFYVEPNETWVLDDFGDDRITLITCNDDGTRRLIVVASLSNQE